MKNLWLTEIRSNRGGGKKVNAVTCKHCGRQKTNRGRGLCQPCYADRGVRALYPKLPTLPWASAADRPRCRHCGLRVGGRPYGLCQPCFENHAGQYREEHREGQGWSAPFAPPTRPAPRPTRSGPGGVVRLLVQAARLQDRCRRDHPEDAREMRLWDVPLCDVVLGQLLTPGPLARRQHGR